MKRSKNSTKERSKKNNFYLTVFNLISNGKNPSQIAKELNISKQRVNYYVDKLKKQDSIKKIGYGVWRSKNSTKHPTQKQVRGHAFIWKIVIPKIKNWDKRINILDKNNIKYKLVGVNQTPRIIIKNRKIWLANKTLVIFEPFSYYGKNSIESRKYAVWALIQVLEVLEKKLQVSFKTKQGYKFKPTREHYSLIKNSLAIQCDKEGRKLTVKTEQGSPWMWVDNSYNLHEAETGHKETALLDSLGLQKYFNEHRETKFQLTPMFLMEMFDKIQQNHLLLQKNLQDMIKITNKRIERLENDKI